MFKINTNTLPIIPKISNFTSEDIDNWFKFVEEGNLTGFNLLINKGIDINIKNDFGWTALMLSTRYNKKNIVVLLLKNPNINVNDINILNQTALIVASKYGYLDIVELLLSNKDIDINVIDKKHKTALMYALSKNYNYVVEAIENLKI